MKLGRGMLRLWVVGSIAWACFALIYVDPVCLAGFDITGEKWWCSYPLASPGPVYITAALFVIAPPLLALILALAVVWVARGFKGSE